MKAVVLLSGGVDSATCLGLAVKKFTADNVVALSIIYGQKHIKEIECAKKLAEYYGVKRYEVDLTSTLQYSDCPLLKHSSKEIEHTAYATRDSGTVDTYVPFRNGLMLGAATALALSIFPNERKVKLYYGAHSDDVAGAAYPDCSESFVESMRAALSNGTAGILTLETPLIACNKSHVVSLGLAAEVPYELTWSCYEGGEKACGTCGTCIDRKKAFEQNGMEDPIEYEK